MRVGILGGGQLGRMLILAGYPLGMKFHTLAPDSDCPSAELAPLTLHDFSDSRSVSTFLNSVDCITYESENLPLGFIQKLEKHKKVFPSSKAIAKAQDRLLEKQLFLDLKIPTTPFYPIGSLDELIRAIAYTGFPAILKTRRMGYDGKGQSVIRKESQISTAWKQLAGAPLILEKFIPFDREVSLIGVRSRTGEIAFYPLVENHHREGILRKSIAPAPRQQALFPLARKYALRLMKKLNYVGVLTIEFFNYRSGLIANEMAPRVHNSGHWTIEGAVTSQFENHLRAIAGLPLGSTEITQNTKMINFIGTLPNPKQLLKQKNAHLHLYGKSPRTNRKLGHLTKRYGLPFGSTKR